MTEINFRKNNKEEVFPVSLVKYKEILLLAKTSAVGCSEV